jgi:DNA repair exonuclease SbcCD ATPase subunit/DNA repair exonuclease SbcCD nuclease subunit
MIKTVANCGDIHIPKKLERHTEYREVFEKFYQKLREQKPDRIVICGDLYNDFIDLENEALILVGEFLTNLAVIAKVILIKGNHDVRKKHKSRIDTIETAVTLLDNPNIIYYKSSGFYPDENVVWVVWDYLDKKWPWRDLPIKKDPNFTYIDLYHNPIINVKLCNGYSYLKKNVPDIKDLKGDISMLSDIHLHQSYVKNTKAYTSSLIQQHFGESEDPKEHGYLLWDIQSKSFQFISIPNNYAFVNFKLTSPIDYDNLSLSSQFVTKNNKFRIVWTDYSANINRENEIKIEKYLRNKYKNVNISEIRFQKFPFHINIEDSKLISEVININDNLVQQDVIREYLNSNKYDGKFIEEIIKIDDIINGRIESGGAINIVWNIDKITFSNFKSYGDDNELDLKDTTGIIQITAPNQYGKTTILDVICYALYGKTISTTKREKFGDNRYINNKRDLNYCEASVVIDVNGEKFLIHRRTDREFDSHGDISKVSTVVNYYEGDHIPSNIDNGKRDDETTKRTQKLIQEVLGDFDDFIRLALTNSDNLNQLLSMDRSVFIDSVVKDAGYEIFEKKLEEFKKYKKELNLEKIVLDPIEIDEQIKETQEKIDISVGQEDDINDNITQTDEKINKGLSIQEKLTLKIHKIDEDIMNLNIENINYEIETDKKKVGENEETINEYKNIISELPDEFDYRKFNDDVEKKSKYEKEYHEKELEVVKWEKMMGENNFKIDNVDIEIDMIKKKVINEKKNEINKLVNSINTEKNKISSIVNEKIREFDKNITKLYNEIGKLDNDLSQLKSDGIKINSEIKSFQNAKNGDKENCPTCGRPMEDCDEEHLVQLIEKKKNEFKEISEMARPKLQKKKDISTQIDVLISSKNAFNSDSFLKENVIEAKLVYQNIENINLQIIKIENEIDNFNIDDYKEEIDKIMTEKVLAEKKNQELKRKIDEYTVTIRKLNSDIDELEKTIIEKNLIKKGLEKRKDYIIKMNKLSQDNNTLEKSIHKNETFIKEYNKNLNKIEENKIINDKIDQSRVILKQLNEQKNELIDKKIVINNMITLYRKTIDDMKDKLKKYQEQVLREELHNVYISIMSRTGLPTYLLKKNIDLLNGELSTLLSITNFNMFFDDNLNYKLEHNGLPGTQNAIESSGAERTFAAFVLKVVLRTINFRSKPTFIFLDEIINRLYLDSVDKFIELLNIVKEKLDKIIIIEHNNEIMADMIIDVKKDEFGVSSFQII